MMQIQITARHCDVPEDVKERTSRLVQKLERYNPRLESADVIFTEERHKKIVEGIVQISGDQPAVARGEGVEHLDAVDDLMEHLTRILRKRRERVTDHRGPGLPVGEGA